MASNCVICVIGDTSTDPPFTGRDSLVRSWLKAAGIHPLTVDYIPLSSPSCVDDALTHDWILGFGETSLRLLCPIRSMTLKTAHGHFWSRRSAKVMATYHPASVKHNREFGSAAELDVLLFAACVKGEVVPAIGHLCVRCKKEPIEVVVDGIGLGRKCKRFARPVLVQMELFEERIADPT